MLRYRSPPGLPDRMRQQRGRLRRTLLFIRNGIASREKHCSDLVVNRCQQATLTAPTANPPQSTPPRIHQPCTAQVGPLRNWSQKPRPETEATVTATRRAVVLFPHPTLTPPQPQTSLSSTGVGWCLMAGVCNVKRVGCTVEAILSKKKRHVVKEKDALGDASLSIRQHLHTETCRPITT